MVAITRKNHLEEIAIGFSTMIGLMSLIIPILVVLSPSRPTDEDEDADFEMVSNHEETAEDVGEEDIELNKKNKTRETIKLNQSRDKGSPKKLKKTWMKKKSRARTKAQKENSKISLVHFSFMFLVSYFLETFICLENLEENLWQFHSHPYVFFLIAMICLLFIHVYCCGPWSVS